MCQHVTVSIHAPAWGATGPIGTGGRKIEFQSTHPRGVRPPSPATPVRPSLCFNPRTRVGCDLPGRCGYALVFRFQSTHPRGVRRWRQPSQRPVLPVSIHAPAWGATGFDEGELLSVDAVSIHAPAWGATGTAEGGSRGVAVSIHAPAWGATHFVLSISHAVLCFNPRTRVGCDPCRMRLQDDA